MDLAPISIRLLLMFLVLGNSIVLIAHSRLRSENWTQGIGAAPARSEVSAGGPRRYAGPAQRIFDLTKSMRPAVKH